MGAPQMMEIGVNVSMEPHQAPWDNQPRSGLKFLHLAWLWVPKAAAGVWEDPSGRGHLDLVTFLGNVFHLGSVAFCHPGLSLCLH